MSEDYKRNIPKI